MPSSQDSSKAVSKQINIYIRRHPFVLSSTESFTTSQRRGFVRDVYDYSRSLGLSKIEAKQQTLKAREMCGEDEYNTDDTSLENEIDDSQAILVRLQNPSKSHTIKQASTAGITLQAQKALHKIRPTQSLPQVSLVDLQKRKRKAPDTESDQRTAQLLEETSMMFPTALQDNDAFMSTKRQSTISTAKIGPQSKPKVLETRRPSLKASKAEDRTPAENGNSSFVSNSVRNDSSDISTISKSNLSKTPATNGVSKVQNFAPPEVVMFSDDDDDTALTKKVQPSTQT